MIQTADLKRGASTSEPLAHGRALRLQAYGGPLTVDRVSAPEPGPGEVLVSVKAAAASFYRTSPTPRV
jgi:hypothetical protein